MSWASWMLWKPPEIWAPVRPSIPSGFSAKLMIGRVLTSLSRTTAKWPESASASSAPGRPIACSWPRWAIARVTSWNASRPPSVKSKVTFGWSNSSVSCFGLVMSVPESAGSSLSANQPGSASSSGCAVGVLRLFGDDDGPDRDLDDFALVGAFAPGGRRCRGLRPVLRAGDQVVRLVFLEEVVARFRRRAVRAVRDRLLFGGELDRAVGGRVGAGEDQLLVGRLFRRRGRRLSIPLRPLRAAPAAVRGPGGRRSPSRGRSGSAPSRRSRAGRSCRPGRSPAAALVTSGRLTEISVVAEARDLGLGDAELVDPFADDLDRACRCRRPMTSLT